MGNKGPLSEEWKQKIRESTTGPKNHFYGKHHTEETKQKISEKRKGIYCKENHPMWGKHPSEKTRRIWSEQRKGRKLTEEWKQKISKNSNRYWTGKHLPEETKQKISKRKKEIGSAKGEKNPMFGKHHTEETKQKMSNINLGRKHTDEYKRKMSERVRGEKHPMWGKHHSEASRQKIREHRPDTHGEKNPFYGKHHSENTRMKISKAIEEKWKNEEIAKKMIASLQFRPNGQELYLDYILQNNFPDEWKYVGDGEFIIGGLCPDFINVNGKKQIIELFGDYWHKGKKNLKEHQTENGRKEAYSKYNYSTLIVWECELQDEEKVIQKIKEFSAMGI